MTSHPRCCFLELPLEIREQIYSYLFVTSGPLFVKSNRSYLRRPLKTDRIFSTYVSSRKPERKREVAARTTGSALLMANRQLREECLDVFFSQNHFTIANSVSREWFSSIGPKNASRLRHIRLDHNMRHNFPKLKPEHWDLMTEYDLTCDIMLIRREPWYTLHILCPDDRWYTPGNLDRIREKMNDVLHSTLCIRSEPVFNHAYLELLIEFWQLWAGTLLTFGRGWGAQ